MISFGLDSAALAGTYDRISDRQFQHGRRLILRLAVAPGESVLDVGCGTGRLSEYVAGLVGPRGAVHAVDPLEQRVQVARQRAKARRNLFVDVAGAEDLSRFPNAAFDVVFLNSVFHWIEDKARALREARRVLKPGGRIGISVASKEQPHQLEAVLALTFARPELADVGQTPSGTPHKVSVPELAGLLNAADFGAHELAVQSFVDFFARPDDVFEFSAASSFGNFLSQLTPDQKRRALPALSEELEKLRTPDGIQLTRNLIFAVARAGAQRA